MKFKIQSKALLNRLNVVSKVISSKNLIASFTTFHMELNGETLTITGSDQENRITTTINVEEAEGEGAICINASYLLNMLKNLSDQMIELTVSDNFLVKLQYQNGKYDFQGTDGNEFPMLLPEQDETQSFSTVAKELTDGLSKTIFAVANDPNRPIMNGVYWDITPEDVTFVATDIHMLARCSNNNIKSNITASCVLPTKACQMLLSILNESEEDDDVKVELNDKSVTFTTSKYTFHTVIIKGRFPNYKVVIGQLVNPYEATIDKVSMLNAVKRAGVFSNAQGMVNLELSENLLRLTASDVDMVTSANENLVCEYSNTPIETTFTCNRIIDILNNIPTDTVIFRLSDPSRPGLISPDVNAEGTDFLVLIMPVVK